MPPKPITTRSCKSSVACDRCTSLKKKCDGLNPCKRCEDFNAECTYSLKKRRGPKKRRKEDPEKANPPKSATLLLPVSLVADSYERSVLMECLSAFRSCMGPICPPPLAAQIDVDPFVTNDPERKFLSLVMAATGELFHEIAFLFHILCKFLRI